MMKDTPRRMRIGGLLAAACLGLACAGLDLGGNSDQATADAFAAALEATRAAEAAASTATANSVATIDALPDTPAPTSTQFPTRTPDTAATAAVEATLTPIRAALSGYGVDPNQGQLGWVHAPKTIELNTYLDTAFATDYPTLLARNFVVEADVTWQTRTGLAGCGFIFRADQSENAYAMGIARGATGVGVFNLIRGGRPSRSTWETSDAPATNFQNGDTNRLAIVGRETTFALYVNGQFTFQVSDAELPAGLVAFAALSESGTSICTYNNGWLWVLD